MLSLLCFLLLLFRFTDTFRFHSILSSKDHVLFNWVFSLLNMIMGDSMFLPSAMLNALCLPVISISLTIWPGKDYYLPELRSKALQRQDFSILHSSTVPHIFWKYITYVLSPFKAFMSSVSLIFFFPIQRKFGILSAQIWGTYCPNTD